MTPRYRKCLYCQVHNRVKDDDDLLRCGACGASLPLKIEADYNEHGARLFGHYPVMLLDHPVMETNAIVMVSHSVRNLGISSQLLADAMEFTDDFMMASDDGGDDWR